MLLNILIVYVPIESLEDKVHLNCNLLEKWCIKLKMIFFRKLWSEKYLI